MINQQHTTQLERSAIPLGIRRERGYWSAMSADEWTRRDGDMAEYQRRIPGLAIPVYQLGRAKPYTMLLRPDDPRVEIRDDGKTRTVKYEWPAGLPLCIDILPRYRDSLKDTSIPIWFTEGAKKADALAGMGQSIIPASLNGVWCWKHKTADGQSVPLADFDAIALKGRQVVLAFDSDQAINDQVQKALTAFAAFLRSRGAIVGNCRLPHGAAKLGVDDAIAAGWTYEQLEAATDWHPTAKPPRLLPRHALGAITPTTWLIDGVLAMNKLSQTFAPPGSGKSFTELDKALCVAQRYPVVYVAAEAVEDYEERVTAWEAHHGAQAGQIYFWPEPIVLKDPASVDAFLNEIHAIQPAAIFIDPLASCMVGLEESSTGDMTIAVEALNHIRRETGAAVHIVHHTGWSDAHERGSSVLRAACRIVMKLTMDDSGLMKLSCEKANNGKPFTSRYFRLVNSAESAVVVPANKVSMRDAPLSEKQFAIMETLDLMHFRDGATHTQITEHTNFAKATVNKAINRLIELGNIAKEPGRNGTYRNTAKGNAELAALDAQFTASSPVHPHGELEVNWRVNNVEKPPENSAEHGVLLPSSPQFTIDREKTAPVHPHGEQNSSPEFTTATALECACSPEFTPSSPLVHHAEFTSSPPSPPLGGRESEQNKSEPADHAWRVIPPRPINVNEHRARHQLEGEAELLAAQQRTSEDDE